MEIILENLSRSGEIHNIKCGEKVRLTIKARPYQKVLVSNGNITSEVGTLDKTGKLIKEIDLSLKDVGSWRQDFCLADNSDKGFIAFNVIDENGEVKVKKSEGILDTLLNPSTLLLIAATGFFLYKDFFTDKPKPEPEPLGDDAEDTDKSDEEEIEEEELQEV